MGQMVKTFLRTIQNHFPFLKHGKDYLYHYGRKWLRIPHEADFRALSLIPDAADALYLDIGANHGQSIASIRLFKPAVKIVSFEPVAHLVQELHRYYDSDQNWSVRACGLGKEPGSFSLFTPVYNGFVYDGLASFSRENAMGWLNDKTIIGFDAAKLSVNEEICQIETLDSQNLSPSFIKIDVQGFEYDALLGGMATIQRCLPIILIEDYGVDARVPDLMAPLGYAPFHYLDGKFVAGAGKLNSFLLTAAHRQALGV